MRARREGSPRHDWGEGSRMAVVRGVLIVAAAGGVAGWLIPRGPVTTQEALGALGVALCVGILAGTAMPLRWALLVVPATFVAVFELARMRVEGPTVDAVRPDDLYGVIALVGGRGVDAVLVLLPLLVGVSYGRWWARRPRSVHDQAPRWRRLRRGALVLSTLGVLLLAAGLLRPASTEPIVDAHGDAVPGSVAELVDVAIGGHDQSLMLRGDSSTAPVLLFLEGGPGGTGIGRIRSSGDDLERSFVVATWDQRGTGKSYDALEPRSTLTLEQMVADTLEVVDYLRARFDTPQVYLVGSSWGTIIGTMAVDRSPEKFHAYVGTGQMVDPFATDRLMYAESVADAEARGDDSAAQALRELGPPPYDDTLDYPAAISSNPRWRNFEHGEDYNPGSEYPASLFAGEYALVEQLRGMAAVAETYAVLYPQLHDTDFRIDVPRLRVPVYLVEGAHEAAGRKTLAREWFTLLEAPAKHWVSFERSGHTPPYDQPGRFAELMESVSTATHGGG